MRSTLQEYVPSTADSPREAGRLLTDLEVIGVEGWDGPTGTRLLDFIRRDLVRPLVLGAGLRGPAADQAEATGWQAAWEVLAGQDVRAAASPWGVVWKAVHRAVFGEVVAARFQVSPRKAWALRAVGSGATPAPFVCGYEDCTDDDGARPAAGDGDVALAVRAAVGDATRALVRAGWPRALAEVLVGRIVEDAEPGQGANVEKTGWRGLSAELGLPGWQVRRVQVALFGAPGWPGLLERLLRADDDAPLADLGVQAALRATRVRSRRSPALEAHRAEAAATLSMAS